MFCLLLAEQQANCKPWNGTWPCLIRFPSQLPIGRYPLAFSPLLLSASLSICSGAMGRPQTTELGKDATKTTQTLLALPVSQKGSWLLKERGWLRPWTEITGAMKSTLSGNMRVPEIRRLEWNSGHEAVIFSGHRAFQSRKSKVFAKLWHHGRKDWSLFFSYTGAS